MPDQPYNIGTGINVYNLANAVDAVYYKPDEEPYAQYATKGWVYLEDSGQEYEDKYGHRTAVYKVPAKTHNGVERSPHELADATVRPGDEIVVIARGSEFKERFNFSSA